jgi:hypothetical protein
MNASIAKKLYSSLYWFSFLMMISFVVANTFQIYENINKPTSDNVKMYRVLTNNEFYTKYLDEPITDDEIDSVKTHMKSSLVTLFDYEGLKIGWIIIGIAQFLLLIMLKKWIDWLFSNN